MKFRTVVIRTVYAYGNFTRLVTIMGDVIKTNGKLPVKFYINYANMLHIVTRPTTICQLRTLNTLRTDGADLRF